MAFVTEKTLYIHIQKTGGMSVREVLYACSPLGRESGDSEAERHFGLPEVRASHPGIESGRLSFGFVRHPVSWIKSRWAFAKMTGFPVHVHHRRDAAVTWMAACWSDDFEQFVSNYLERYPGIATQTMFRMLGLWSGKPVDYIGKTENLLDDLAIVLEQAGERVPVAMGGARSNATATEILSQINLSPSLAAAIMNAEASLCQRFDYG